MKITNIILTSLDGGAEQVFIDYMIVLKNLGHEVSAIIKKDAPYAAKLEQMSIRTKKINNFFGYYDQLAINSIKKELLDFNSNLVVAHAGRAICLSHKAIKKIKNKKVLQVAVNHSMNVKRSIVADIVISVNKPIFYRTIDLGKSEKNSFVVPNAVDFSDIVKVAPHFDVSKKDVVVIGGMARLDNAKGFRSSILAIKHLEKISDRKFILKIAGVGKQEKELRELVKKLNLESKVEFLGWVNDRKSFYNQIDIFCMSSYRETFGLVVIEAIKYRKPIVSTNADGPSEILRDELDALIANIEPIDSLPERFAAAILRMVGDPELVNKILENSYQRLLKNYSFDSLEKRICDIVGKA